MAPSFVTTRYEPNRSDPKPSLPPHSLITYETGRYTRAQLRELKRRLVAELHVVRSLLARLDTALKKKKKRGRKPGFRANPDPMMRKCRQILGKLMRRKRAWAFNEPVDVAGLGLYDYHRVVARPMDLGRVMSNLDRGAYVSPLDFAADVRLTFSNAAAYNPLGHPIHLAAVDLLAVFGKAFSPLLREYEESRGARRTSVDVVGVPGTARLAASTDVVKKSPVLVGGARGDDDEEEEKEEEEAVDIGEVGLAGGHPPVVIVKDSSSTGYTSSSRSSSTSGSDLGSVQSPHVGAGQS